MLIMLSLGSCEGSTCPRAPHYKGKPIGVLESVVTKSVSSLWGEKSSLPNCASGVQEPIEPAENGCIYILDEVLRRGCAPIVCNPAKPS